MCLGTHELHGHRCHHQDSDHAGQHCKIAECFCDGVEILAHWSGGEDLSDARVGVTLHRALHDVEAREREKGGTADGHQGADPGGVVNAAIAIANNDPDFLCGDSVSDPKSACQGEQETVAAHALEEVGAHHVIEDAGLVHATTPASIFGLTVAARCCARQNK